MYNMIIDYSV